MPADTLLYLLALIASVVTSSIIATWILSAKLGTLKSELIAVKSEMLAEISILKTDLAVLKKSEQARDDKINQMWLWWMTALENGWANHMRSQEIRQAVSKETQ